MICAADVDASEVLQQARPRDSEASPASSSMPSMSSESKSSMSVKSSIVATKWVVGGIEFLHCPYPNLGDRSPAMVLLIKRETLVSSEYRRKASAGRCPRQ